MRSFWIGTFWWPWPSKDFHPSDVQSYTHGHSHPEIQNPMTVVASTQYSDCCSKCKTCKSSLKLFHRSKCLTPHTAHHNTALELRAAQTNRLWGILWWESDWHPGQEKLILSTIMSGLHYQTHSAVGLIKLSSSSFYGIHMAWRLMPIRNYRGLLPFVLWPQYLLEFRAVIFCCSLTDPATFLSNQINYML